MESLDTDFIDLHAAFVAACEKKNFREICRIFPRMIRIARLCVYLCQDLVGSIVNYIRQYPFDQDYGYLEEYLRCRSVYMDPFSQHFKKLVRYLEYLLDAADRINWKHLKCLDAGHPHHRRAKALRICRKNLKIIRKRAKKIYHSAEKDESLIKGFMRLYREMEADMSEERLSLRRRTKRYRPKKYFCNE